jgi:hypothetical protein
MPFISPSWSTQEIKPLLCIRTIGQNQNSLRMPRRWLQWRVSLHNDSLILCELFTYVNPSWRYKTRITTNFKGQMDRLPGRTKGAGKTSCVTHIKVSCVFYSTTGWRNFRVRLRKWMKYTLTMMGIMTVNFILKIFSLELCKYVWTVSITVAARGLIYELP